MDGINEVIAGIGGSTAAGENRSVLSQENFLEIMISELTNQDPLEPLDNNQFLNQLTQMQTLEATTRLTEGIESLIFGQQITSAGVLIGRTVTGVDDSGAAVEGTVDRVLVEDGEVLLGIGDTTLPMNGVREVLGVTESETE